MSRFQPPSAGIIGVALLIVSLWAAGLVASDVASGNGVHWDREGTVSMSENETRVAVDIECDRNRVELAAPGDRRYDLTVAVVNLTPESNDVSRTTVGSVDGNETLSFTGEGIVLAFVEESSADTGIVATDAANCAADTGEINSTVQPDDAEPTIRIDCAESVAQFTAPEGTEYVAKVTVATVSPANSSTKSVSRTLEGNATVSVDEAGLVAAFASTGDLGDDRTVSAIRHCVSDGDELTSEDEQVDEPP